MKVTVSRTRLLESLKSVLPAASSRATLPILAGVHLKAEPHALVLETTDLEAAARLYIDDGVNVEAAGSVVVAAKPLAKALRAMADEVVTLNLDEGRVTIRAGSRVLTLDSYPVQDWPAVTAAEEASSIGSAPAAVLSEALLRASICASKDEARAVLTTVALMFEKGSSTLRVVATDSYRLGMLEVQLETEAAEPRTVLVPARVAKEIAKTMRHCRGDASIGIINGQTGSVTVTVSFDAMSWTTRLVDGEFPNWRQVMPGGDGAVVTFDSKELASALKTAQAVASNGAPVRLRLGEECSLSLVENDSPIIAETLASASFEPDGVGEIEVAFNPAYLADSLRFLGTETARMRVRDGLKPALLGSDDRRYLLMPVRIS